MQKLLELGYFSNFFPMSSTDLQYVEQVWFLPDTAMWITYG